jgi:TonB-dependent receptor-like protein/carboxypeptidase family protein
MMSFTPSSRRNTFALLAAVVLVLAGTNPARAGTTGTLTGYVLTVAGAPVSGATVSVTSPTESATDVTDVDGYFAFIALPPDTYDVTVHKDGYLVTTQAGVTVISDNAITMRLALNEAAKVRSLGNIIVSAQPGLLRPSTTVDVYSVNGLQQKTMSSFGGGGDLENAYSAIAAVPGTFIPTGQTGWNQPVFVRGGDFTEIGYEFDGVPVNRSFDRVPTTNLSSLGVQSLDVYTGGAPADAEGNGLSGYINQVIKRGTYPGFADVNVGVGSPALYNKVSIEAGGATPNRTFSYFTAFGGYNQGFRYYDQNNGAGVSGAFGMPFDIGGGANCFTSPNPSNYSGCYANHAYFQAFPAGPGGYVLGPYQMGKNSSIADRENLVNLHFLVPRRNSVDHDDVQLLYDTSQLYTYTYSSYADWGGPPFWNGIDGAAGGFHSLIPGGNYPAFLGGFQYNGSLLQAVTGANGGPIDGIVPYLFPSEGQAGFNGPVPGQKQDAVSNGQSIIKLQYQHSFGTTAYARVYGYSYYSDEFIHSPNGANQFFISTSPDREFWTHTHGYSVSYADQLNSKHLFDLQASYSISQNAFFDNGQTSNANPLSPQSYFAALVNSASPTSGICYNSTFNPVSCEPTTAFVMNNGQPLCNSFSGPGACFLSYALPYASLPPGFEWLAVENGPNGQTNAVTPKFTSFSIEDQYRPTDRLHVNAGIRYDRFAFQLPPTAGGAARAFWFNAWNAVMCVNPGVNGGNPVDETLLGLPAGTPCSAAGPGFSQATLTNDSAGGASMSHGVFQPRVGATFDASDDDVVRFSFGAYAQAPPTRALANDVLQQNLPGFIGPLFFSLGFTSPVHDLRPPVSYNADFSWEHRFSRTDASFKFTPFYRRTRDQIQQFFINPTFGTTTDINAGRQTSFGAEFMLAKGNFDKNGFSAQFSFTYTHSRITYNALPNGATLLSGANASIQQYNSFTSACAGALPSTDPASLCGINGGTNAVATFPSTVANPYFNAPVRPLLDPFGSYPTFDVVPTGLQLTSASYGVPVYTTLVLNYRHDKWTFTPLFQLIAGSRYGGPQQQIGVDPTTCAPLAGGGSVTGDPRYPFGGTGSPYDATTCANTMFIPDQFSGNFDSPGAFREPSQFTANLQVAYRASDRATVRVTATNVYLRCFGGDTEPWNVSDRRFCGYDVLAGHLPPVGNIFNPGDTIQRIVQFPYGVEQLAQPAPTNVYVNLEVKL